MPSRFFAGISIALASALGGTNARAACTPPAWLKTIEVKATAGEIVATGKGATAALARREARRTIGMKIAKPRLGEILSLPQTKDQVNRKVYAKEDLLQGTALAVALNVKKPKRIAQAVVCDVHYAAISANVKAVLAQLKQNSSLGEEINAGLTGKIDPLEEREDDKEASEAAAAYQMPEQALKRLQIAVEALGGDDLMSTQMQRLLRKKAQRLKDGIDQKEKVDKLEDEARDGEKVLAAAKELKAKSYIALFEMLNPRASDGEEEAQFMVGFMYSEAMGVKRDDAEALKWLRRAASKNYGPAKALIGVMTYSGRGTKADKKEALKWLESAQSDGWSCDLSLNQCSR